MTFDLEHSASLAEASFTSARGELRTLRFRDIRRDFSLAPGGQSHEDLIRAFLPGIYGLASLLMPENPTAAASVSVAVFQTFALRWRKPSRRAFVGVWLFQTTLLAALAERKRWKLPKPPKKSAARVQAQFFRALHRLKSKIRNILILHQVFQAPVVSISAALRLPVGRVEKRLSASLTRLEKRFQKLDFDPRAAFSSIGTGLPAETPDEVLTQLRQSFTPSREPLVRSTIRSWRWIRFRTFIRRTLAVTGGTVTVLAITAGIFVYLATHGYLTAFFIRQGQRQAFKDFPELRLPARPWPVTAEDQARVAKFVPDSPNQLFGLSNIWTVKLSFTAEEWARIEPSKVPPIRNMFQDGKIILRNPKAKRSGLAGVLGFEFNWVEANLEFANQKFEKVAVRYRGNGTYLNSMYGQKQSIKIDVSKFNKKARLGAVQELNLLNTVVDYSYLHDALGETLFRQLGALAPRTAYAYVTVEISGKPEPRGLYVMVENIDGEFAEDRFGNKKVPIFKPVTYDLFDYLGADWKSYEQIYDLKTKATPEQQQRVIDFARLVSKASDDEFARRLPEFLDLDEFAGFVAGHVLLSSYDGFLVNGQNFYFYLDPRSNRFGFIPWDQDHSWGDFGHIGTNEQRENASIWNPSTYDFQFLKRVMKVEAFRKIYRQKLENALNEFFTTEHLYPKIDELAHHLRPAVQAESDFRVARFDKAVSGTWLSGPRDGEAEGPKAPIHQIKRFIANRAKSVRDQLDSKAAGGKLKGFH
ncbi:MAG TPA: CotH kinase family protein [Verrucomicrobiae bacterium]|nr:CotH kinase family protein [Verrucomicrobiae bacterium]